MTRGNIYSTGNAIVDENAKLNISDLLQSPDRPAGNGRESFGKSDRCRADKRMKGK